MVRSTDHFLATAMTSAFASLSMTIFTHLDRLLAMRVHPFLFRAIRLHGLPNTGWHSLFTSTESNITCRRENLKLVSMAASILSVANNKPRARSNQEHLTIHVILLVSLSLVPCSIRKLGPLSEIPKSHGAISLVRLRECQSGFADNLKSKR